MSFCKGILKLSNDVILNNKKLYTNFELTFEIQPLGAIFSKLRLYRFGTDILVPLRFYADVWSQCAWTQGFLDGHRLV